MDHTALGGVTFRGRVWESTSRYWDPRLWARRGTGVYLRPDEVLIRVPCSSIDPGRCEVFPRPALEWGRLYFWVRDRIREMLRKPVEGEAPVVAAGPVKKDGVGIKCPLVWDYLTQTAWEDGTARQTATVLFFLQDGVFKAMLKDKATARCLWVSASSLEGLWVALESELKKDVPEWRADRQQPGDQAKRVRRAG